MKKKQIKSKYIRKTFGKWKCVHVGIASTTLTHKNGGPDYYYVFERMTSDNKCLKTVILNSSQACKVYRNEKTVEEYAERLKSKQSKNYTEQIKYTFR